MDRDTNQKSADLSTPAGRVAWVLKRVWQGSQSKMGRDIGVTQSAVSAIVTGTRRPGNRFLAKLAAYPMVNANWLFNGLGEPLVAEEQPGLGGRYFCPVADVPLAGSPRNFRDQLTGFYRPVAAPDFDEDRYWFRVTGDDFAVKGVIAGDWLLMDASGTWLKQPQMITGQPCVVRAGRTNAPTIAVRWLQYDADAKPAGKYVTDLLAMADDEPTFPDNRKPRKVRLPGTTGSAKTSATRIKLTDVVAIAVKLERPWA